MKHCLLSFTTIKRGRTKSKELVLVDETSGHTILRATTDETFATGCFLFYSAASEGLPIGYVEPDMTGLVYTLKDQTGQVISSTSISFALQPHPVSLRVRLAEDPSMMPIVCAFPSLAMCSGSSAFDAEPTHRQASSSSPVRRPRHAYGGIEAQDDGPDYEPNYRGTGESYHLRYGTVDAFGSSSGAAYNPHSQGKVSNRPPPPQSLNSSHSSIASTKREWGGETASDLYIPPHPSLASRHASMQHTGHEGTEFTTRSPKWNSETNCYLHNLGSRVKQASNKNFVLISSERNREDDHAKVFLRFGQLTRDTYVLDWR